MNKKSNKGFLLAESLIVTTFVLTVLIYLFAQFKNLMIEYKNNYKYNTVEDIYNLGSISSYITKNNIILSDYGYIYKNSEVPLPEENFLLEQMINTMNIDYLIYEDSDIDAVKNRMSKYNQDMQDFIEKIKTIKIENKGRLIAKFNNGNFATIMIEKNNQDQP